MSCHILSYPTTPYPQDKYHLYLLFDLMSGGDLMDVLVAEARVIRRRIAQGAWRRACLAPKARPGAPGLPCPAHGSDPHITVVAPACCPWHAPMLGTYPDMGTPSHGMGAHFRELHIPSYAALAAAAHMMYECEDHSFQRVRTYVLT